MVQAGAEGQGEGRGDQAVGRRQADPFNLAENERLDGPVLAVSEDEEKQAKRMAVEGGPGQPAAPNVPAAAMESIPPEVLRKEEGKSKRGRAEAGAAESGDSGVGTAGQGRTGKGGKEQLGASAARHATGHQEGKGGKRGGQGRHWPQPQRSFKQPPPGSPPQVSAAVLAKEEREECRQQAVRYEALAHMERQRCHHQLPEPAPDTIYGLEMGSGRGGLEYKGGQEGWGGCTADNPVAGCGEGKGMQDRAAQQRRASGPAGGKARE